jgi:mannose-6-phosphate isomerase-like protein (cupin superfamily)
MKAYALSAVGLAFALIAGGAQAEDQPRYVASKDLSAMLANGALSAPVPTGLGAVVLVAHRDKTGDVEIHTKLNDELVARSGRASVLIGAKVEGAKETAPNELRGGTIVGGKTYELAPGDVIWIPAGLGHQVIVPKGGSFEYLAVKFDAKAAAQP